jgi:hypothetical protein
MTSPLSVESTANVGAASDARHLRCCCCCCSIGRRPPDVVSVAVGFGFFLDYCASFGLISNGVPLDIQLIVNNR